MKVEVINKTEVMPNEGLFVQSKVVGNTTILIELKDGGEKFTSELRLLILKYQNKEKPASEILKMFKEKEAAKRFWPLPSDKVSKQ